MSLQAHLDELVTKHRSLDAQIETVQSNPSADDLKLASLKREKLKLKDEIARVEARLNGTH
ncbi:YdcH family protein [Kaustia mangrovi]|uniref:YdcH family protein n=1 Tax=Kaustia mangrovi TaxID=2593653 RepID=A0A7S8C2K5_9HYPH|nr:YdcH family protein [Kaustia mangrovi]QPC42157.1 YdcH family protein [Kaustia mangrovi]